MKNFVSLHTMTEYSFMESTIRIDDLINFAKENNLEALAITDRNNMHGTAEFIDKCKKNNIKPIIGIDIDIEEYRFILLAKNFEGYKYIMALASKKAFGEEIAINDLQTTDIYLIDHPEHGYFKKTGSQLTLPNYYVGTKNDIGNGVYIHETKILTKEDNSALKIIDSLRAGKRIEDEYDFEGYPLNPGNDAPVKQAMAIAEDCKIVFPKEKHFLPKIKNDEGITSEAFLKKLINKNAKTLLDKKENKNDYIERIKYEVSVIDKLGYADYFLIISDLIYFAKKQGIVVGPGRGSAAGSLIAFILGITEIDPLEYDLLFERFLNPERVTMPDIDIDIQDTRRDEVIKYLFDKYGEDKVALISTFQKLGAKSSIRDVARLLGIQNSEALALTKPIPNNTSLDEAFKTSTRFRSIVTKTELNQEIFNLAKKIEGLPRQIGTHAAGIVVSDSIITDKSPLVKSSEGLNQIQFSMDYIEDHNLLKIDLLGLRNLTILKSIQDQVFKNYKRKVDLKKIPNSDNITNQLLSEANTNGIFQFESYGMKKTLKTVKVNSFDDIVAILSLYRPGPMEYIDVYARRKHGKENIPKVSKDFDEVTKNTYGIIVYQEQIMQIAQKFAGMSFGQADILRRAIGKKKIALINSLKEAFIKGAIKKGSTEKEAKEVYRQIEAFANYGFNKSHAVAYATLSYRLAFLKGRFPFEFYTALIQASIGSLTSLKTYINEAKNSKIKITAPNINISEFDVSNKDKAIVLPLGIIKGLGNIANNKIIEERTKNPFKDFFDLVTRLKFNGLGESIIISLIKSNALRDFGNMQTLIDSIPQALRYADMVIVKKDGEKVIDFEMIPKPKLIESESDIKLEVKAEESIYGFNIYSSLTTHYEKEFKLVDLKLKHKLTVVVYIEAQKALKDRFGKDMGIIKLSDSTTSIEAMAFYEVFKFLKDQKAKQIVEVEVEYNKERDNYQITAPWKVINVKK